MRIRFLLLKGTGLSLLRAVINAVDAIDNQKVLKLVQEQNAEDRTIGVVTKCDRVEDLATTKVSFSRIRPVFKYD